MLMKTKSIFLKAVLLFACLCLTAHAQAKPTAGEFISSVANTLEQSLKKAEQESLLQNEAHLDQIIDENIIPYLDLAQLAKKISGEYWSQMQEQTLTQAMQDAIVAALKRTYRVALAAYTGEKITVSHSKNYSNYSLVRVQVKTSNKSHALDFALRQQGGEWRVFDVSVDGIVFSKTLQSSLQEQFAAQPLAKVISNLKGGD